MTEQEILAACACTKVRMAARAVTRAYDGALRPVGLRATQLSVLVAIAADEALSISALAEVLGMERTTLTRNLRPLEAEGLVALGNEGWRRSRTLKLTKKGRALLKQAVPLWEAAQVALQGKLGGKRWEAVRANLDDLIATS